MDNSGASWAHLLKATHWKQQGHNTTEWRVLKLIQGPYYGGSVAEWLACWTQAQKGLGSNRSRDAVG